MVTAALSEIKTGFGHLGKQMQYA